MGLSVLPAPAGGKTRYATTLTSGTSYTVPAGVTYVNATLVGGGGSGGLFGQVSSAIYEATRGSGGEVTMSFVATTPGASVAYAVAAAGGTTTFTGATSASGGGGGTDYNGSAPGSSSGMTARNGGNPGNTRGGGGSGAIYLEYWL
jgi:hypothetical protein